MSDSNQTNLTIIIVLSIVIIAVGGYVTIQHLFSNNKELLNEEVIPEGDTSIEETNQYESYKIGDSVTLSDGSSWNVIFDSEKEEEEVSLLKSTQLDSLVDFQKARDYIENTYSKQLATSLGVSRDKVTARLLSFNDITNITGITNLELGVSLEDSNYSFLYNYSTLTNQTEDNLPILICGKEDSSYEFATLCLEKSSKLLKVRPVIIISKEYI